MEGQGVMHLGVIRLCGEREFCGGWKVVSSKETADVTCIYEIWEIEQSSLRKVAKGKE